MKTLAIAGTFDSKGEEFLFIKKMAEQLNLKTFMIHTGVFEPAFLPDVSNREIAAAAGADIDAIVKRKDRAQATEVLAKGMQLLLPKLFSEGKFDGILSCGGSGGTALVTPAMRELPIGVPKIMVSTMASGNVSQYVGASDIVMIPSIVDVAGLNKISKTIFSNAVFAIAGMLNFSKDLIAEQKDNKPLIAASMFGVTTPCVNYAKAYLEKAGYEVLVFHATGTGGKTMDSLIDAGVFAGVLDLTTTEWCDQVVGGVLSAGSNRCEAAIRNRIPQVVSVGALDMVNFGPIESIPEHFSGRQFYKHNPQVTLMRTSVPECAKISDELASRWDKAETPMAVMLPLKGISMIDGEGQPFDGPEQRKTIFEVMKNRIHNDKVEIIELDNHINDQVFAESCAKKLIELIRNQKS